MTTPDLLSPQLRRGNRIKTIQASLAIENNTLSVEQVTAVIEGKRVLGLPREIQEVNNAFSAYVPVETVFRDKQDEYYQALADSDRLSESSPFIGFMLKALLTALKQIDDSPVEPCNIDELDNAVQRVINVLSELGAVKLVDLMASLELKHRPTFKKGYLDSAIKLGLVEMSNPDKPRSPNQLYRLTSLGKKAVKR